MSTARNSDSADPSDLALLLGSSNNNNNYNNNNNNRNNNNNNNNCSRNRSGGTPRKYASAGAPSSIRMCPASNMTSNQSNKQLSSICQRAQAGHKLMIIMRGPPGSGKSTLAESLVRQAHLLDRHQVRDFVLSSDDYFKTRHGYDFNPTLLPAAHEWNQQRVRDKAACGWSPIIVDNTNTMVWEMQPYVQCAVRHGYVIELLEPQTSWCKSASKLAQKNVHSVPRENIQRMLERYERTTAGELIQLMKETKYSVELPQLRKHPPLPAVPVITSFEESKPLEAPVPAPAENTFKLNANAQTWVPYEQGAPSYWSQTVSSEDTGDATVPEIPEALAAPALEKSEVSIIDLLREESKLKEEPSKAEHYEAKLFQRHCLDCHNEPKGFALLRQMYPNKQLTGLWDLFVKCKADVDWAVDILLKEDELYAVTGSEQIGFEETVDSEEAAQFQCDCDKAAEGQESPISTSNCTSPTLPLSKTASKPQRQPRIKRASAPTNKELQIQIQNCFVLGDEQYSEHTRKIRDIRNGILDQPIVPKVPEASEEPELEQQEEEDPEENTLLEIDLGSALIEQLRAQFYTEDEMLPPEQELPAATKIFVPRQLAKQLYMLWMEAVFNQLEEMRQQTMRDDEQFARLLKHPGYADCRESPSNVAELLDMELAWSIYNSEQQAAKKAAELAARKQTPNDIATHLTKMKLCETFPDIPPDTVLEIFAATGSNYVQTVEVLDSNVQSMLSEAELYDKALREGEKLSAQVALEERKQKQQKQQNSSSQGPRISSSSTAPGRSPQLHEDAKCAALRDFEETRNMAAHHSQLKAECYLKAKQAVQRGNGSVALYYSEIAKLHKQKIDVFNHRAANCIMEVHRHTQNNPDLLDLHYLHTVEAISCLDLFLDRHITVLRNTTRVYKHVFIITGRGLHSANGVSTIKNRVKARLSERRLRWQEVNPGLLRVKVFSASRHSKNF
ncbi:uncharacterized protein LOC6539337 [Drosophila yakuba]|uniref:Uncharacterized protein, isoform B n=1 Tax=Drosophila yakuba TaxID=7245 RepID=A0A0R1EDF1_DROYA|nr:uncharacterized protein LOC6539337 [Drosophila yakuba]XP_039230564.1 uncharacterized protein LOC6539337 [Drosophila yakuba]KRK05162.1 uncharacterized protein Dyak_GE22996, isoform B [Drosophila yakuba]